MVKMISGINGSPMWVHETRVEEYLARGHRLAPPPEPPKPEKKAPQPAEGREVTGPVS